MACRWVAQATSCVTEGTQGIACTSPQGGVKPCMIDASLVTSTVDIINHLLISNDTLYSLEASAAENNTSNHLQYLYIYIYIYIYMHGAWTSE